LNIIHNIFNLRDTEVDINMYSSSSIKVT
jgi:hypothetical protein